jgi:chorismate mutase
VCKEVAHYKKANNINLMQPDRIEVVKSRCASRAAKSNVNPEFIKKLYSLIIEEACRLEHEIIEKK